MGGVGQAPLGADLLEEDRTGQRGLDVLTRTAVRLALRLSHLREWPAAYIRYELPRGNAGLFIVDDPEQRFRATGREVRMGPSVVRVANAPWGKAPQFITARRKRFCPGAGG